MLIGAHLCTGVQEEAAHDAVLLLDRAMSVGGVGMDGCLALAAAACLHLALCQDMNHSKDALPALSSIATHTGPFPGFIWCGLAIKIQAL